jgi:hypothetical protein
MMSLTILVKRFAVQEGRSIPDVRPSFDHPGESRLSELDLP